MKKTNTGLVKFAINHLGTPYVMGTNCLVLTKSTLDWLIAKNPSGWFKSSRIPTVRKLVGHSATDCHGLIEGYVNDYNENGIVDPGEGTWDTYADYGFNSSKRKGPINTIPEEVGLCVRYPGHVGVYIGYGLVVEAKGFDDGTVITKLSDRPWTHWYEHKEIEIVSDKLEVPSEPIIKTSEVYNIVWLQIMLNQQILRGRIKCKELVVDGKYGDKTASAIRLWQAYKKWTVGTGFFVGVNTIKSLYV